MAPGKFQSVARLFVAIEIPEMVKAALEAEVMPLRRELELQWSPARNWHVTLAFLGESEPKAVMEALASGPIVDPFDLTLAPWGAFPNPRSARVLWAGITGGPLLPQLANQVRNVLSSVAPEMDLKPFKPHLTLARSRTTTDLSALSLRVPELSWRVTEFVLVESRLNARPTFLNLAHYPLFR